MEISYKLPDFEGPLDLLLHLVQKNKLNIYDIPIHELLEQYMDTIHTMQELDMDVATEFLDMAARLVQIKSAMLLPRHEEADELKQQLTGELIEYQLCREAAERMRRQCIGGDLFVREPAEIEPDYTYRRRHAAAELLDAYLAAAGRGRRKLPPSPHVFHNIVARKIVSVSSKIIFVLRRLRKGSTVSYRSLYENAQTKSDLVATFLAVLELIKGKRITVDGEGERQKVTLLSRKGEAEHGS
ncbi:MAG: segregation/condensation protein A [Clostridia bacterium]|nr:segregation/condensation protein A [Clostridia bacterium]